MIKGSSQEEDITIESIYAPNTRVPQRIERILTSIKEEIDSKTIILEDFNTPFSLMDRSYRQKSNKGT